MPEDAIAIKTMGKRQAPYPGELLITNIKHGTEQLLELPLLC